TLTLSIDILYYALTKLCWAYQKEAWFLQSPSSSILFNYEAEAQQTAATQVLVGGGNNTHPFFGYSPQQVQIKAGGSVVWKAPTSNVPPEPHTVTFVFNNKTMAGPDAPFAVPSSTKFMPLPPGANSKPNIVPGGQNGMNTVIVSNAMSYNPALIDSTGNAKTFSPNGNLTITGNEQYVNSGWLVPKGGEQIFPGSSHTFTATFQKAGTYSYTCTLHPWMAGQVVVK
ncbi:MAG: plastocyanin/azurin family copper-binding protein, partial [Candidatus Nitrosopolaris sp.]